MCCRSDHIKVSDYTIDSINEGKLSEDKYYLQYWNSLRSYRYSYTQNLSIHDYCLFNNLYKRITDVKEPNRGMNEYLEQKKSKK